MAAIPTVKIRSETAELGYIIINEEDFDESLHVLHDDDVGKAEEVKAMAAKKKGRG